MGCFRRMWQARSAFRPPEMPVQASHLPELRANVGRPPHDRNARVCGSVLAVQAPARSRRSGRACLVCSPNTHAMPTRGAVEATQPFLRSPGRPSETPSAASRGIGVVSGETDRDCRRPAGCSQVRARSLCRAGGPTPSWGRSRVSRRASGRSLGCGRAAVSTTACRLSLLRNLRAVGGLVSGPDAPTHRLTEEARCQPREAPPIDCASCSRKIGCTSRPAASMPSPRRWSSGQASTSRS